LARGEEALLATLPNGTQLEAKIVYVDPDLDIALAKTAGEGFPHLPLAEAATVRQGESVLAIGNPGDAMLFSVTKGIVSAIGRFDAAGLAPGFRPMHPLTPATAVGRCSIPAAK
jgi:serine protease Do